MASACPTLRCSGGWGTHNLLLGGYCASPIENSLHWQLDVTFGEDDNRVRDRNAAQNLALFRKWAVGLLKRAPGKESMKVKRYQAALNTKFLEEILES